MPPSPCQVGVLPSRADGAAVGRQCRAGGVGRKAVVAGGGIDEVRFRHERIGVESKIRLIPREFGLRIVGFLLPAHDRFIRRPVEVVVQGQPAVPVVPHAGATLGGADEDVITHDDSGRGGGVVIEHQVCAVTVGTLVVRPAVAGIHASVVLEDDVARDDGCGTVPEFKGIFGIPDHIVAVGDVDLV